MFLRAIDNERKERRYRICTDRVQDVGDCTDQVCLFAVDKEREEDEQEARAEHLDETIVSREEHKRRALRLIKQRERDKADKVEMCACVLVCVYTCMTSVRA